MVIFFEPRELIPWDGLSKLIPTHFPKPQLAAFRTFRRKKNNREGRDRHDATLFFFGGGKVAST